MTNKSESELSPEYFFGYQKNHHFSDKTTQSVKVIGALPSFRADRQWRCKDPVMPLLTDSNHQRVGRINAYCAHSPRRNSTLIAFDLSIFASTASNSLALAISEFAMATITSPSRSPARAAAPS